MSTIRSLTPRIAVVAALALVLASCGDDASTAVDTTATTSEDVAAEPAQETEEPGGELPDDGGYGYVSDVSAHRLVVQDVCEVNELLDVEPIDFQAVSELYRDGEHSVNADGSVRSLAGFATATDKLHGFDDHHGTDAPLDEYVAAAIEGTGDFAGEADLVRRQGVQKGIQNQVMVAWVLHELNAALAKADDGDFDAAEGAPHNWDEAWAFYHGAAPDCAPFATADKRGADFGTTSEGSERSLANEAILDAMVEGRDALLDEDADAARAAADEVKRNLVITYSQAIVKYAGSVETDLDDGDTELARIHQAEGDAFFRVIEPLLAEAGADVDAIGAVLALSNEPGSNGGADEVRAALQPALDTWEITEADIGTLG